MFNMINLMDLGRTILYHGINVSGGAKLPIGIPSHAREGYWIDYDRKVNFVGRPFPLEEADLHLEQLKQFGFNLLRFVITWEAIDMKGRIGIYDFEYINYVVQILLKCRKYDLKVFIDPHQDTWSRHCGGSGHPGWTLSLAGFHPLRFASTIAALVHNTYSDPETFPRMIWNTNYERLAAQTMFTLFFAGKTFAPNCIINDMNIQDYLQQHFFNAIAQLIKKLIEHDLQDDIVIGYDTMNEPGKGYLEFPDLTQLDNSDTSFKMGLMPTPFQAMLLGSGIPAKVAHYKFIWSGPKKTGDVLVNPNGEKEEEEDNRTTAWLTKDELKEVDEIFGWKRGDQWKKNGGCVWELHKVWDKSTQTLLCPHYFANDPSHENKPTQFAEHYWIPFINDYIQTIRTYHQKAIIFVQPPIIDKPPKLPSDNINFQRLVYTPHWYDGLTLVKKKWCSYNIDFINLNRGKYGSGPLRFIRAMCFGEKSIRNCFIKQIKTIREEGLEQIGPYPCLLGEIGIPYDMEKKENDKTKAHLATSPPSFLWQYLTLCFGSLISSFYNNNDNTIYLKNNNSVLDPDSPQNKAMDASINAVENNLVNYTLWHYVPDNNMHWGDRWNGEDLSIWQQQEEKDDDEPIETIVTTAHNKKKGLEEDTKSFSESITINTSTEDINKSYVLSAKTINQRQIVCLYRPHPKLTAGIPSSISFESPTTKKEAFYCYEFKARTNIKNKVTEIYIPCNVFPPPFSPSILDNVTQDNNHSGTQVSISVGGEWKANEINKEYWILHWWWNNDQLLKENDFKMKLELKGIKWN
ncbi:unnamed protein product [Cunninghamella blakesleeana]